MKISRLTRDETAEPVPRDQILRRERGQGNINFPCLADHEQDWQPYPLDPTLIIYVMTIQSEINVEQALLRELTIRHYYAMEYKDIKKEFT